jgi:pSer/pThr/pTyr-binding forkhead associated (FHA) protein
MPEIQLHSADGKHFSIEGITQIGRENECAITLYDPRVSRIHATLTIKDGFLYVRDEGSSNGTFINRIRIFKPTLLQDGDQLRVGDTIFAVRYLPLSEEELSLAQQDTDVNKAKRMVYPTVTIRNVNAQPLPKPHDSEEPRSQKSALFSIWSKVILFAILLLAVAAGFWLLPRWLITNDTHPQLEVTQSLLGMIDSEGGSLDTSDGVHITIPKRAFKQMISIFSVVSPSTPPLPVPIQPQKDLYTFQLGNEEQPRFPINISLPLAKDLLTDNFIDSISAYRLEGKQWQYLGGNVVNGKLIFSTDKLGSFESGIMQKHTDQSEFRSILFINKGDTPISLRPWQVWQPPEDKLPAGIDPLTSLTFIDTHPIQSYEKDVQGHSFGYINLPFGTYKSWCLSWLNEHDTLQYAVLNAERSLTPYTCRWVDYINGRCKSETVAFDITPQTQGVSDCAQSTQ